MNCLICRADRVMPSIWGGYYYEGVKYGILSCNRCGFTFVDPMPDQDIITKMYSDEYFEKYYSGNNGSYIVDSLANDIRKIGGLKKIKDSGNLLDVGCGSGRFVELALESGYRCSAIEPNTRQAERVRHLLSIEVYNSTLETADLPMGQFDIIHVGDTLEHAKDPYFFISKIKSALKPDGILMLDLPIAYNRSIFNYLLRLDMFFRINRYSSNPPYHLLEFNRKTIKMFFRNNKMRIIKADIYENRPISPNNTVKHKKIKFYLYYAAKTVSYIFSDYLGGKYFGFGDRITIISNKDGQ